MGTIKICASGTNIKKKETKLYLIFDAKTISFFILFWQDNSSIRSVYRWPKDRMFLVVEYWYKPYCIEITSFSNRIYHYFCKCFRCHVYIQYLEVDLHLLSKTLELIKMKWIWNKKTMICDSFLSSLKLMWFCGIRDGDYKEVQTK
jgi:hypothetical protein